MPRKDKCKCGHWITWDPHEVKNFDEGIECGFCGIKYSIESESTLIYWLREKLEPEKPWETIPR